METEQLRKSGLKQGPISSDDLIRSLMNAKKVMNKVDSGNFSKGHINETSLSSNEVENVIPESKEIKNIPQRSNNNQSQDIDRIKNSKLPNEIKEAMIKHPISDVSLKDGLDLNIFDRAKKMMSESGDITSRKKVEPFYKQRQSTQNTQNNQLVEQQHYSNSPINESVLVKMIEPIVENTIRKIISESFDKKLDQILAAHDTSSINENLVIRVGDSIFQGKIVKMKIVPKK